MSHIKSMFPILLSMLVAADALAWYPWGLSNPGYYGPYADRAGSQNVGKGIRVEKDMDEGDYILRIHLSGMSPEAIEMKIMRSSLLLRTSQANMSRDRNEYGERSFSHSFSLNKRIRLPYDADGSKMERIDGPDLIEIRIPRRQWY